MTEGKLRTAFARLARNLWREVFRRRLGLSAMHAVLRELRRRGVQVQGLHALETFGGYGDQHIRYYAPYVASIDVWEIRHEYREILAKNLPAAQITITDSYQEIQRTAKRFDLVVIDNPYSTDRDHWEHFDFFPGVFRVTQDSATLILNVVPSADARTRRRYPRTFSEAHLACRASFYHTDCPEHVTFEEMAVSYARHGAAKGYRLAWYFAQPRKYLFFGPNCMHYLVLKFDRNPED